MTSSTFPPKIITTLAFCVFTAIFALLQGHARAQVQGHDYGPFAAVYGYQIENYHDVKFDYFDFVINNAGTRKRVEGHKITINYSIKDQSGAGSGLLILRTVEEEAKAVNARFLYLASEDNPCLGSDQSTVSLQYEFQNTPIYVNISCSDAANYEVDVIEEMPFKL